MKKLLFLSIILLGCKKETNTTPIQNQVVTINTVTPTYDDIIATVVGDIQLKIIYKRDSFFYPKPFTTVYGSFNWTKTFKMTKGDTLYIQASSSMGNWNNLYFTRLKLTKNDSIIYHDYGYGVYEYTYIR